VIQNYSVEILLHIRGVVFLTALALIGPGHAPVSFDSRLAEQLIRESLAYHPPIYEVELDAATPGRAVTALERAGIIEYVSTYDTCSGRYEAVRQTEAGLTLAASNMWPTIHGFLTVPLGRFAYVRNSERINVQSGAPVSVTFRFTFVGNGDVARLAKIGPASIWHVESPVGLSLTAADAGRTFKETIAVDPPRNDSDEWTLAGATPSVKCSMDDGVPADTSPANGATPIPAPALKPSDVPTMMVANLNYNTPQVTINLSCGRSTSATRLLERAGIVERDGAAKTCWNGADFRRQLTARGLEMAAARGWVVGPGYVSIPVGRLVPIPHSFSVDYEQSRPEWLTYSFRLQTNANATYLAQIAPASQWCVSAFPPPPSLSLADAGHIRTRRVLMLQGGETGWTLLRNWFDPSARC
jgi:hypothetical protein